MSFNITPLAAESMGTRSMATFVECGKINVLIDPGASLAGRRFNLPPHSLEKWRLQKHLDRIQLFAKSAQVIIITCFHSDHFSEDLKGIYKNKLIFIQNPNSKLHVTRRKAAFHFLKTIKGIPRDIVYMDNRTFEMGQLRLVFSNPMQSNNEEKGDSVISVILQQNNASFWYSSNIEGLYKPEHLNWALHYSPTFFYLDGPNTYRRGHIHKSNHLSIFFSQMKNLFEQAPLKTGIIDHHMTRDKDWRKKIQPVFEMAGINKIKLHTAADYRGEKTDLLEARRQQLYEDEPNPS